MGTILLSIAVVWNVAVARKLFNRGGLWVPSLNMAAAGFALFTIARVTGNF
jgi:hypothetical protein